MPISIHEASSWNPPRSELPMTLKIRASQKASQINADLERYWRELKAGTSAEAVRNYESARRAAKAMGISPSLDDPAQRVIEELFARIKKLPSGNRVEDLHSTLAVYDAAPRPDITFRECAIQYIDSRKAGWKNEKHRKEWMGTLESYVFPVIGDIEVKKINGNGEGTNLILKILEPLWHTKTGTASRIRGRIESVLDWATVRGFREGSNPAVPVSERTLDEKCRVGGAPSSPLNNGGRNWSAGDRPQNCLRATRIAGLR